MIISGKTKKKTYGDSDYHGCGCVDMIVDERIITFINSMDTENSEILEQIEKGGTCRFRSDHPAGDAELPQDAPYAEKTCAYP